MSTRLLEIIGRFKKTTVLVVGDLIADVYIVGNTSRISREAPVLILEFDSERVFLGGAGNAANNARACGAKTYLAGAVGVDAHGDAVWAKLQKQGIETDAVLRSDAVNTSVKTRILAGGRHTTRQQIVRLDKCPSLNIDEDTRADLLKRLEKAALNADAIIISDYGHGLVSDEAFRTLLSIANDRNIPITVDTRYGILRFADVTAQTPNETEIEELLGVPLQTDDAMLIEKGAELRDRLALEALLITRGSKGMMLIHESGHEAIPIFGSDEVADVTGAGDTVVAVFTLSLACGASFSEAGHLANIAGGIVVMKRGTATVSANELIDAVNGLEGD